MKSWKRRYRSLHKLAYQAWKTGPSRNYEPWGLKLWRKRRMYVYARDHKKVDEALKQFETSMYVEDCRYHPCLVTKLEPNHYYGRLDLDVESLVNGVGSSCSYFHCGIVHLTEQQAKDRTAFIKQMGMLPYQLKYIYLVSSETIDGRDAAVRAVRGSLRMEQDWQFNKNQHTPEVTDAGKAWLHDEYDIDFSAMTPFTDEELEAIQDDINVFAN